MPRRVRSCRRRRVTTACSPARYRRPPPAGVKRLTRAATARLNHPAGMALARASPRILGTSRPRAGRRPTERPRSGRPPGAPAQPRLRGAAGDRGDHRGAGFRGGLRVPRAGRLPPEGDLHPPSARPGFPGRAGVVAASGSGGRRLLVALAIRYLPGRGWPVAGGRLQDGTAPPRSPSFPESSWPPWPRWSSAPSSDLRCRSSCSAAAWLCCSCASPGGMFPSGPGLWWAPPEASPPSAP